MQNFRIKRLRQEDGIAYMKQFLYNVKKVGQVYQAKCPFHVERTGSLTLFPPGYISTRGIQDYATFYCFGCAKGGDIIKFKSLLEHISYKQAIGVLEEEFGLISDDEQGELNFLQSELQLQTNQLINDFTFDDISLLISSYCRQYLKYIQQNYPQQYIYEENLIEYYYRYIDYMFDRLNISSLNDLFKLIKIHLNYRKQQFYDKYIKKSV